MIPALRHIGRLGGVPSAIRDGEPVSAANRVRRSSVPRSRGTVFENDAAARSRRPSPSACVPLPPDAESPKDSRERGPPSSIRAWRLSLAWLESTLPCRPVSAMDVRAAAARLGGHCGGPIAHSRKRSQNSYTTRGDTTPSASQRLSHEPILGRRATVRSNGPHIMFQPLGSVAHAESGCRCKVPVSQLRSVVRVCGLQSNSSSRNSRFSFVSRFR